MEGSRRLKKEYFVYNLLARKYMSAAVCHKRARSFLDTMLELLVHSHLLFKRQKKKQLFFSKTKYLN